MKKCNYCKEDMLNPKYNQIYCCDECREDKYDEDRLQLKKLNPCEICGFWRFVERHHIIKQIDWGSNSSKNIVRLCPNHHKMADSFRYGQEFLKLLKKKTGRVGEKLSNKQIQKVKQFIFNELKGTPCGDDRNEDNYLFVITHRGLIRSGEFYDIALNDKHYKINNEEIKQLTRR